MVHRLPTATVSTLLTQVHSDPCATRLDSAHSHVVLSFSQNLTLRIEQSGTQRRLQGTPAEEAGPQSACYHQTRGSAFELRGMSQLSSKDKTQKHPPTSCVLCNKRTNPSVPTRRTGTAHRSHKTHGRVRQQSFNVRVLQTEMNRRTDALDRDSAGEIRIPSEAKRTYRKRMTVCLL